MTRVYLAGPEVFLPDSVEVGKRKKELCRQHGFTGVYPMDNELDHFSGSKRAIGLEIFRLNEELIKTCQVVVANMTPFRGPSCDVGTAYEMGYAKGIGLKVYAYSNIDTLYHDRALGYERDVSNSSYQDSSGNWRDGYDMLFEDFCMVDNLMLDGCVVSTTGKDIVTQEIEKLWEDYKQLYYNLDAFEKCLKLVKV